MEDTITIDAVGRLVVPKAIRVRLALSEGSRLRIREEDGKRIVIEPVGDENVPEDVDGLLVIQGRLTGPIPDHREQRLRRIRGSGRMHR